MKKLLSLLTISTLTASVPAPLLANTVQTRVKRDVAFVDGKTNSNKSMDKKIVLALLKVEMQTMIHLQI